MTYKDTRKAIRAYLQKENENMSQLAPFHGIYSIVFLVRLGLHPMSS